MMQPLVFDSCDASAYIGLNEELCIYETGLFKQVAIGK